MGLVVAGTAIAVGGIVGAALTSATARRTRRGPRRSAGIARGLRRGAMAGCAVGLIALLRVLDGLTPLTAVFVVAPFIVAETLLSTRRA